RKGDGATRPAARIERDLRLRNDADIGGVEILLLAGLGRPYEEGFIDRALRRGFALEIAQRHQVSGDVGLAQLQLIEPLRQRLFLRPGTLELEPDRSGDAIELG